MPLLRFLHAAGARIDHQLDQPGWLPDDARAIVERATITAFERLVAAAVEHAVDFVLLTGDSFEVRDRSLRARIALVSGLRELAEYGIPVFVAPGAADPVDAWQSIADLPENVTLLPDVQAQPADFWRDDRRLATAHSGAAARLRVEIFGTAPDEDCESVQEYVALGGPGVRRTLTLGRGIAHHPGTLQGVRTDEIGAHGCTLVEVEPDGEFRRNFLPLAPVRRERFEIAADPGTTWDELRGRIQNVLLACAPEPGEEMWLAEWRIAGTGALIEKLAKEHQQRELAEAVEWDAGLEHDVRVHHSFRLQHRTPHIASSESSDGEDGLAAEFLESLAISSNRSAAAGNSGGRAWLGDVLPARGAWQQRIDTATAELDPAAILSHARRLGLAWFGTPLEGPGA